MQCAFVFHSTLLAPYYRSGDSVCKRCGFSADLRSAVGEISARNLPFAYLEAADCLNLVSVTIGC